MDIVYILTCHYLLGQFFDFNKNTKLRQFQLSVTITQVKVWSVGQKSYSFLYYAKFNKITIEIVPKTHLYCIFILYIYIVYVLESSVCGQLTFFFFYVSATQRPINKLSNLESLVSKYYNIPCINITGKKLNLEQFQYTVNK